MNTYVRTRRQPVAIVGMACRFPGAANLAAFWRLLLGGEDAIGEIPRGRFDGHALSTLAGAEAGTGALRRGGFLSDVDQFDAAFFGLSPREAERADPQHRLLLEVSWEAVEDAGFLPNRLAGSLAGVFIGMMTNEYEVLLFSRPDTIDVHGLVGNQRSVAAARVAYALDLRGPNIVVDTAASSSLTAVHLAVQSLRNGECDLALAGGVNLVLRPNNTAGFSRAGMIAPDGRCKFGDAAADGFVRSDGVGVVVLKCLTAARAAGDRVYAVIRGSAVNNDGRTGGYLMTPSAESQTALISLACRNANVAPSQIQYVEAHGTGTKTGDPVEILALARALCDHRSPDHPIIIGSVKTNIGHTEGAAGIAGLIKAALSLHHRCIPPSLHFQHPNPSIPWDELPVIVQQESGPWPARSGPAVAGVSSFGIGGANAHVILEQAPTAPAPRRQPAPFDGWPLVISAPDSAGLSRLSRSYIDLMSDEGHTPSLADLCYTAAVRRQHHPERLSLVVRSAEDVTAQLSAFLNGEQGSGMYANRVPAEARPRLVFVFSGQGSQWVGMGRRLLRTESAFRAAVRQCDDALRAHADWSLLDALRATGVRSEYSDIRIIQQTLFALELAISRLWCSWGLTPDCVVGHSLGEVVAACVAGSLTVEEGVRIVHERSRLMRTVSGQGAVAVVELESEAACAALAGYEGVLSIAAYNSRTSTVIAGEPAPLRNLLERLGGAGIYCQEVTVDVAAHTAQMEPLAAQLADRLADLHPRPAAIPFCSAVTGTWVAGEALDGAYWARNLRQPVRFSQAIHGLLADGPVAFVEISPHPILRSAIRQDLGLAGSPAWSFPSLRRGDEAGTGLLATLGGLYTLGFPVDWRPFFPRRARVVSLPSYPWQHQRFWVPGSRAPGESAPRAEEDLPCVETEAADSRVNRSVLVHMDAGEAEALLLSTLRQQVARVLRLPADRIDTQLPLVRLGLDSLMAVEINHWIESNLEIGVSVTTFLRDQTLAQLAGGFAGQITGMAETAMARASTQQSNPACGDDVQARVDRLSPQEVDRLLAELLDSQEDVRT